MPEGWQVSERRTTPRLPVPSRVVRRPVKATLSPMPLITLTTDFGLHDAYAGTLKGVIHRICPSARIVDLTHDIEPGNIRAAAFTLLTATPFFPPKTLHVAVVDPGVGSRRAALAIRTRHAVFIGPDNGLFEPALRGQTILDCRHIQNPALCLAERSRTFHGRDVFAPVAAHLARGVAFSKVGPRCAQRVDLPWPQPDRAGTTLHGEVVHVDRFGNAITNLPNAWLEAAAPPEAHVQAGRTRRIPIGSCYLSVPEGAPLAIAGSSGFLEVAVNRGSAAEKLRLTVGSKVTVQGCP